MANYVRFESERGELLVEVDDREVAADDGGQGGRELNAGLRERAKYRTEQVVAVASATFEDAVRKAIGLNVGAFLGAAEALERRPSQMEITFGLKGTGELSNVAVGRLGGEVNYQVKMMWTSQDAKH